MYAVEDENRLVHEIIEGDKEKYRILIRRYRRLVSTVVSGMISNRDDRQELGQEIFVKIYKNLSTFKFRSKLSTWIARIAYNTCIKYLRKKRIPLLEDTSEEKLKNPDNLESRIDTFVSDGLSPDRILEEKQIIEMLSREIENLPVKYRVVISFYHVENMSMGEISSITGLPEGTVKSQLFRARKILKERILMLYRNEEICQKNI